MKKCYIRKLKTPTKQHRNNNTIFGRIVGSLN